jgi:hypothetical protein
MNSEVSRRDLLKLASAAIPVGILGVPLDPSANHAAAVGSGRAISETFPSHPPEMVRETVLVAHFNLKRLKELVEARPALARAAWDWGFGDWESALGAASHMGNRPIAEYLLSRGARPTLFSATMLGELEVVRSFIAAQPGAQRIRGPHSISLLAHARYGGPAAKPVFDYLQSLGDSDADPEAPIADADRTMLLGTYRFGDGATEQIDVTMEHNAFLKIDQLTWTRKGTMGRPLYHLGDRVFFPAGAQAVRVKFTLADPSGATVMTVSDGDFSLAVTRSA